MMKVYKFSVGNVLRFLVLVIVVLFVSAIPFVVAGAWLEPWIEKSLGDSAGGSTLLANPLAAGSLVVVILGSDIFLPVPSSAVCTWAGKALGPWGGTLACWIGLNIAAAVGYWLGRSFGSRAVERFADPQTAASLEKLSRGSATACLVACRGLPIVAEASVLLMGIRKLPLGQFWPPVMLANAGVAAALCVLGSVSARYSFFPSALAISIAFPLLFIAFWKWRKR